MFGQNIVTTGRLTRVEAHFAFLQTPHGRVFCLESPRTGPISNFAIGDEVDVMIVPQRETSGCKWMAINIRHSGRQIEFGRGSPVPYLGYATAFPQIPIASRQMGDSRPPSTTSNQNLPYSSTESNIANDEKVVVTEVLQKFALASSDTFGKVYIPCEAFSMNSVQLDQYLEKGDKVIVTLRAQNDPKNYGGCRFFASTATRIRKEGEQDVGALHFFTAFYLYNPSLAFNMKSPRLQIEANFM
ncbi:unnamed protein product [Strongylus vulgaris]|uniref:Uncharacterized protein n=1 Tax=Strongylus vulgaris TaxID=40348 RepID=A0A3P7K977_STRVU|nr:unnamed protein product [Strongylus vulgaris]